MTSIFLLHLRYALLGLLMGAVLSRIGFSSFDEVNRMFTFADPRLLLTFAAAVALMMVGFFVLGRGQNMQRKILHPGTVPGSMLFGAGWAITGSCPSIALVQLGEGQLPAIFTVLGVFFGAWVYKDIHATFFRWDTGACE